MIESIYAGPQGAFTPKSFAPIAPCRPSGARLHRGADGRHGHQLPLQAFHDVGEDLKDAASGPHSGTGPSPRISWYDISRVGVYGGSAGGQNALGACSPSGIYDAASPSRQPRQPMTRSGGMNSTWAGHRARVSQSPTSTMLQAAGQADAGCRRARHQRGPFIAYQVAKPSSKPERRSTSSSSRRGTPKGDYASDVGGISS